MKNNNSKLAEHVLAVIKKKHDARVITENERAIAKEKERTESFADALRDKFGLPFTPALIEPRLVIDPERKIFVEHNDQYGRAHLAVGFECPKCEKAHVARYDIAANEMHEHVERIKTFIDAGIPDKTLAAKFNYPPCLHPPIVHDDWQFELVEKLADVIDMVNGVLQDRHAPDGQ